MLTHLRQTYRPIIPQALSDLSSCHFADGPTLPVAPGISFASAPVALGQKSSPRAFSPLRVGAVFSGGPAPGGHNVIAGLFDALKKLHPESRLVGFLDGPGGVLEGKMRQLTAEAIAPYRNQGGFDLLGTGRTKLETEGQFQTCRAVFEKLQLDAFIIIGGDDSNTSAALLANALPMTVIGVPKTIDGDLQNAYVPLSFGFDTATKIYSELIGNVARDALSAKKYVHFIKLMGRNASHVTLECALATHPNLVLIGEERKSLAAITQKIADTIRQRAEQGKNYGVILIPEGLVDFMPPETLPEPIQKQFFRERDPHGNIALSAIDTDLLLIESVRRVFPGKFQPVRHFFGYEGRCGLPTNFDANYSYALGLTAALLAAHRRTGVMAFISHLEKPPAQWGFGGVPLAPLMKLEMRNGKEKPVIAKALVDLPGKSYLRLRKESPAWEFSDDYQTPGPIQFFGDPSLTDSPPKIL